MLEKNLESGRSPRGPPFGVSVSGNSGHWGAMEGLEATCNLARCVQKSESVHYFTCAHVRQFTFCGGLTGSRAARTRFRRPLLCSLINLPCRPPAAVLHRAPAFPHPSTTNHEPPSTSVHTTTASTPRVHHHTYYRPEQEHIPLPTLSCGTPPAHHAWTQRPRHHGRRQPH